MKRALLFGFAGIVVLSAAAACSDLFDTAVQCTTNRDCEKRGATCDVSRGVCVPRTDGTGLDGSTTGPVDATVEDAPPPDPSCTVPVKFTADVPNTPITATTDAGSAGTGEITTPVTLDCTKDWNLKSRVYVRAGNTLTIQANTKIKVSSGAGLVIQRGARIVANGFRDQPIVFTSDKDTPVLADYWYGLVVLGASGPAGTVDGDTQMPFGGGNAADDNGVLTFVRTEYTNYGLFLGGVGSGTKVDYVQARKTTNAFTFFGGTVDAKHLVSQGTGDEAFEMVGGYTGRLQFLFATGSPAGNGHQAVLSDGAATSPTVYNVTVCNGSKAEVNYGVFTRNGAKLTMGNSIVSGWFGGLDVVGAPGNPFEITGSVFFDNTGNPAYLEDPDGGVNQYQDDDGQFDEIGFINDATRKNSLTDPALVGCTNQNGPQPWPPAAIPADPPPAGFDTAATYVGAFKDPTDTWMSGAWVRFGAQ